MAQVTLTLTKSVIDRPERQKRTVKALGLGRMNSSVTKERNPQIDGMIRAVSHLLTITE